MNNKPFAEIMESSLQGFLAQSWEWNTFAQFGSMVAVTSNNRLFCGIVHQVQTGSMDPIRYPFAYKKTEIELLAEQPQIFEFLKTTLNVAIIGYQEKNRLFYLLPPEPAKIHTFVSPMPHELTKKFFSCPDFLPLLFSLQNTTFNIDELLLALIKQHKDVIDKNNIMEIVDSFRLITGNDYRRLELFLLRIPMN